MTLQLQLKSVKSRTSRANISVFHITKAHVQIDSLKSIYSKK